MTTQSWFESGYAAADREQEKRDLGGAPKRWWMRARDTKQLVFVDDNPACFDEHSWRTHGSKFPMFGTCLAKILQGGEPCPACAHKGVGRADLTGHLTIIDISGYVTKEGKEVKFELVELCPKLRVLNKLKSKKVTKGSLCGQLYSVSRADENAPNTGDDFDHIREANMEALYKAVTYRGKNLSEMIGIANAPGEQAVKVRRYLAHHFQIPDDGLIPEVIPAFNYMKIHEPMDVADFRSAIAGAVGFGTGSGNGAAGTGGGSTTADETVPF